MGTISLTDEEVETLYQEETIKVEEPDVLHLEVVEVTDWESSGKYDFANMIVRDADTNKFYSFCISRTGSYYTDYEMQYGNVGYEVEKKQVTVEQWVQV